METVTDKRPDWAWSCGEDRAHGVLTQYGHHNITIKSVALFAVYAHWLSCTLMDVSSLAEVVGKPDCMSFDWFYEAVKWIMKKKAKPPSRMPPGCWVRATLIGPAFSVCRVRPSSTPPKEKTRHFVLLSVCVLPVAGWFWTETPALELQCNL